ncbi:MAG: hypothetical protein OXN44_13155 [Acidimicrobiaceae bacterium]|nr:hypothetical protein [Acidimicrobiaceae bacterium]
MTDPDTVTGAGAGSEDVVIGNDAFTGSDLVTSSDLVSGSDIVPPPKPRLGGGGTLDQLMPVVLFLGFYNLLSIEAAVVASTLWSFKAAVSRRRRGLNIGLMLPSVTAYLLVRSAVTIAAEREFVDFGISTEAVYFGIGFATKILIGVVLAVTILSGRSFMAWIAERLLRLPEGMAEDRRFVRTMATATWFIVAFEILTAIWDIYLYNNAGINLFVLTRFGVNFTLGFIAITGGLMYIDHKLQPIPGYPGLTELLQRSSIVPDKSKTSSE